MRGRFGNSDAPLPSARIRRRRSSQRSWVYAHLQSLELGFFDSQQTGQLMSRATVDLQAVRFFLGYGLIFIGQSVVTVIVAAALMFSLNPLLGALTLAPMPLIVWIAFRY